MGNFTLSIPEMQHKLAQSPSQQPQWPQNKLNSTTRQVIIDSIAANVGNV